MKIAFEDNEIELPPEIPKTHDHNKHHEHRVVDQKFKANQPFNEKNNDPESSIEQPKITPPG